MWLGIYPSARSDLGGAAMMPHAWVPATHVGAWIELLPPDSAWHLGSASVDGSLSYVSVWKGACRVCVYGSLPCVCCVCVRELAVCLCVCGWE